MHVTSLATSAERMHVTVPAPQPLLPGRTCRV